MTTEALEAAPLQRLDGRRGLSQHLCGVREAEVRDDPQQHDIALVVGQGIEHGHRLRRAVDEGETRVDAGLLWEVAHDESGSARRPPPLVDEAPSGDVEAEGAERRGVTIEAIECTERLGEDLVGKTIGVLRSAAGGVAAQRSGERGEELSVGPGLSGTSGCDDVGGCSRDGGSVGAHVRYIVGGAHGDTTDPSFSQAGLRWGSGRGFSPSRCGWARLVAHNAFGGTNMEAIIFIGRILFSAIFVGSGIGHLAQTDQTAATAEAAGLPNARVMAQASGVAFLLGGIGVISGFWIDLAFLGIAVVVLAAAFTVHPFWKMEGEAQMMHMPHFMKNVSIAGACLMGFGFFAYGWDATTIVGPALDLR